MSLMKRLIKGPYPLGVFLVVTSIGAALITAGLVALQGWATYAGEAQIPGAVHISESFFTGLLATMITGIIFHRHASRGGSCMTLAHLGHCPFLGLFILGLVLGGIAILFIALIQGTGPIAFGDLVRTKAIQGGLTGLVLPTLFHFSKLFKHPLIEYDHLKKPVWKNLKSEPKKSSVGAYLFNLIVGTVVVNMILFPAITWVFYHSKTMIEGAVVGTELFFGGLICTMIVGVTGHFEAAQKKGCLTCKRRGNCPFLGIFILGIVMGLMCFLGGHLYLGSGDVPFKTLIWVKVFQGLYLGIAIPLAMVQLNLLLNPFVLHNQLNLEL